MSNTNFNLLNNQLLTLSQSVPQSELLAAALELFKKHNTTQEEFFKWQLTTIFSPAV